MKFLLSVIPILFSFYSCSTLINDNPDNKKNIGTPNQNFDWLLGNWIRTNEKENKKTFERWEKKSDAEYIGLAYTMQNKDTIWREDVKLLNSNKEWSFNVTGKGEKASTNFKLIEIDKGKFTCENQANEFPKIIMYTILGNTLHAKISGGDMEILFDFVKEP